MDALVSTVLVIFLIAARKILFSLFTNDETVIQIGCEMLVLITPWYIVYVFIEVLAGALRGVGDVIVPVIITLLGICVMRIAWLIDVYKRQVFLLHTFPGCCQRRNCLCHQICNQNQK